MLAQKAEQQQQQQQLSESAFASELDMGMMNLGGVYQAQVQQSYFNVPIVDDLTTANSFDPYTYSPSHTQASSFGYVESPTTYFAPPSGYSIPPPKTNANVYQQQQQQGQWYDPAAVDYGMYGGQGGFEGSS